MAQVISMPIRTLDGRAFPRGEKLGNGGFGRTFGCSTDDGNPDFAIKTLSLSPKYKDNVALFESEIDRFADVRSPVIARVIGLIHGDSETRSLPSIVIPYFPNGSLESLIEESIKTPEDELPLTRKMMLMFSVASAMKKLHRLPKIRMKKKRNLTLNLRNCSRNMIH